MNTKKINSLLLTVIGSYGLIMIFYYQKLPWLRGNIPITENKFRTLFTTRWDSWNTTVDLNLQEESLRYVIYRCGKGMNTCTGWGGRVKGMILGYLMAYLTNRTFKIEMFTPDCKLTDYFSPKKVDWRMPQTIHETVDRKNIQNSSILVIDYLNRLPGLFETINFTKVIGQDHPYVYMKANRDYIDILKRNEPHARRLSWMKSMRKDEIYSELYRRLFRLSPRMRERLQLFFNEHVPTPGHRLVCAQVRMGVRSTLNVTGEVLRVSPAGLPSLWTFLTKHSLGDLDKVFIMSDSYKVFEEARRQRFGSKIISTPGPIKHIEKSWMDSNVCQAFEKVIFDQAVLMSCDILLVSDSSLGRMAAFIRGSDEGLYCIFRHGQIIDCKGHQFTTLYNLLD